MKKPEEKMEVERPMEKSDTNFAAAVQKRIQLQFPSVKVTNATPLRRPKSGKGV